MDCSLRPEYSNSETFLRTCDNADNAGLLDTAFLTAEQVLLDLLKVLLSIKFVLIKDADLDFQRGA